MVLRFFTIRNDAICRAFWHRFLVTLLSAMLVMSWPTNALADADDDDCNDGELQTLGLILVGLATTAPWWGPPTVIDDEYYVAAHFPRYPYFNGEGGYLRLEEYPDVQIHPWATKTLVDYGTDYDDVNRIGVNWQLDTKKRWGFNGEWVYFDESIAEDDSDHYSFGDMNAIWRFAQSGHAMWWTGVGAHWLDRDHGTDWGYQITYGADVFVGEPWILSGALDWGRTNSDLASNSSFFHGRITLGRQWRHGEAFIGLETLNAGPTEVDTMLFGFRVWY
jgi:hypothetical protein